MSEEKPIGLTVVEKFFGLLAILIGALTVNFTYTDPPEDIAAPFSGIFIAAGIALIAIGVFLVLAKTE
jgi:hypothetical protein